MKWCQSLQTNLEPSARADDESGLGLSKGHNTTPPSFPPSIPPSPVSPSALLVCVLPPSPKAAADMHREAREAADADDTSFHSSAAGNDGEDEEEEEGSNHCVRGARDSRASPHKKMT